MDGYAPFCKHVFVPNFVQRKGEQRPDHGGERAPPVEEWVQRAVGGGIGHLDALVSGVGRGGAGGELGCDFIFSARRLVLEHAAVHEQGGGPPLLNAPWGIISIKAQNEDYETPMQPITMMRNALGREEGGSSPRPLERDRTTLRRQGRLAPRTPRSSRAKTARAAIRPRQATK